MVAYFFFATVSNSRIYFPFFTQAYLINQRSLSIFWVWRYLPIPPVRVLVCRFYCGSVCMLLPLIKKLTKSDEQLLLVSLLIIGVFGLFRAFFLNLVDDRFFIYFLLFIGGIIVNNRKIFETPFSKNKELLLVITGHFNTESIICISTTLLLKLFR